MIVNTTVAQILRWYRQVFTASIVLLMSLLVTAESLSTWRLSDQASLVVLAAGFLAVVQLVMLSVLYIVIAMRGWCALKTISVSRETVGLVLLAFSLAVTAVTWWNGWDSLCIGFAVPLPLLSLREMTGEHT